MAATEFIKKCGYCGRENVADAFYCQECGTSLEHEQSGNFRVLRSSLAKSSLAVAIATGLAAFLISTGVYCAMGRWSVEQVPDTPKLYLPAEKTTLYASEVIIRYGVTEQQILRLAIVVLTVAVCWMRCRKRWHAVLVAAVTLGIMVAIQILPSCHILVPALAVGMTMDSPTLFYTGAVLQIVIGVLLLFWFRRREDFDQI